MTNNNLLERIKNIYRKIASSAIRSGRNPEDVKLVAVTKTVPIDRIKESIELGLRLFGENRVQEAKEKIEKIKKDYPDCFVKWHMIGHLQKNKAKLAVELFDMIHSVDSIELAELLNKYSERNGKIQDILIQVKLSPEESKHGINKKELLEILKNISYFKNINLLGLMTIPPYFENPEMSRPFFKELRLLKEEMETFGFKLPELSMGMTNDFEIAILEGATMVRIGTAIFGERNRELGVRSSNLT